MRKLLATLFVVACLSTVAFAGDIPGDAPAPPCTQNCPGMNAEPTVMPGAPDTDSNPDEFAIREFLTGILLLVF